MCPQYRIVLLEYLDNEVPYNLDFNLYYDEITEQIMGSKSSTYEED
jgi:hypothetical protein